jgi:hypothetical protein
MKPNQTRQQFLLSFFDDAGYQEKQVNGFWLVKQFNGNTKSWQVAIFTNDSFRNYKDYTEKNKQLDLLKRE